ncbi:MAG: S8 family serine peptidase [Arenicella sp.]|nr:S8 family serine peptidase [Arenicella sp.]
MKTHFSKFKLAANVGALAFIVGITPVNAAQNQPVNSAQFDANSFSLSGTQPTVTGELKSDTDGIYIVRLEDQPIATYDGNSEASAQGYAATSARANGKTKLDTKSKSANEYRGYLKRKQNKTLDEASAAFGRTLNSKYDYQYAINGFAVALTVDEAKALATMDGVVSVQAERNERMLTDVGPAWIGAPEIWNDYRIGSKGEGMVVAVFDSGINSDHPSFADIGGDGYDHTNPLGSGNYLPGSYCDATDAGFCNDKLIGAWDFISIDGTVPEDDDGHGSHTTSTVAGNVVLGAELVAPTTTASFDISGVAPHANVIAYDVCQETCPGAALVAAVNQIIIDAGNLPNGIAALNYSISGGGDPYNDAVELGFLAAVEAGICVSASAGNSGPGASTVAHLGPWVATTAASTHNRAIANSLVDINSDGGSLADRNGSSFSAGYGPATIIHANTTAFDPAGQCLDPFPAGTFSGEIVVCDRGSIARTEKGQNVLAGGAGGYVLANLGQGEGTSADAHFLPAIHLGDTLGAELRDYLAVNTNAVATITASGFDLAASNGDIMAGFSSRGPQLAFDVLKPDLTAPGVNIMGAEANGQAIQAPEYQIISGTSMSSPHNAGAGALMTAARPHWTPTEIKSAIMMTGVTDNTFKEDGVTATDPFDLGAGRVSLGDAVDAGLVLSETAANFLAANPETGGDPSTLNLPSMMDSNCVGTCSWTRTVTNKTRRSGKWDVTVSGLGFDAEVTISQPGHHNHNRGRHGYRGWYGYGWYGHHNKKAKLKLRRGQSATITVTATNFTSEQGWQFGTLNLERRGRGPDLHMPMAVFASKASNETLFTKTVDSELASAGDTLTYELNVTNGPLTGPITVTDELPAGTTFVANSATESVNNGSTSSAWSYDAGTNALSWTGELDPGGLEVAPNFPVTNYIPMSGFAAPFALPADCDDGAITLNVPSFTYNGASYTQVIWSMNGTIEAGSASGVGTSFLNQEFPDATPPNNILAPFWRDLNPCAGGNLYVAILNSGAFEWTVYEWEDIQHFGSTDAATFQVWVLNDGSPTGVLPQAHFTYGRLDNTTVGATVGAENMDGTVGDAMFYNGAGIPPQVGVDVHVNTLDGGSATLGFQVETDCSTDTIVNQGDLSNSGANEVAIAATSCD